MSRPYAGGRTFAYSLTERFAGMDAAAARNLNAAETGFAKARNLEHRLPRRVDHAQVRSWFTRAQPDRIGPGDRGRARQMLIEARALSESIGLQGHTGWIDVRLGRCWGLK